MCFIEKWLNPDLNPNPYLDLPAIGLVHHNGFSLENYMAINMLLSSPAF